MIRGIYTGACGMLANETRQNVTANNLANIDTTGFKKDVAVFSMEPDNEIYRVNDLNQVSKKRFSDVSRYIGNMGTGSVVADVYTTSSQGNIVVTDNPSDLAISGEGYFAMETPAGVKYTRSGNFVVTKEGFLTDATGNYVLGAGQAAADDLVGASTLLDENGNLGVQYDRIKVDPDQKYSVGEEGVISQNGQYVSKLIIAKFEKNNFINKSGGSLVEPLPGNNISAAQDYKINQNALEASNVNAVFEMVNMIELQRAYEMNQKVILTQDEMLQRSINSVGRLNS